MYKQQSNRKVFLIKYGELALKGKNKTIFEDKVISNVKNALLEYKLKVTKPYNRFILEFRDDEFEKDGGITEKDYLKVLDVLRNRIFGISYVSIAEIVESEMEVFKTKALELAKEFYAENKDKILIKTFKAETKRNDKNFPKTSVETDLEVGSHLGVYFSELGVKLKKPDMTVFIEILQDYTFIYVNRYKALRGMPVGSAGRVGLLLSGGIDSPVAGYLAQKRGCYLHCIYFHSPPHTSEKAKQKVITLAKKLTNYQYKIKLYVINFTETQLLLKKNTKREYFVVLGRRVMIRIANIIAERKNLLALVTGENLGQVASQTLQNLHCVNELAEKPILRPLITYDKDETVELAQQIDTYNTSILPYDDCCTLFLPPKPNTKAQVKYLEYEEKNVNIEEIVNKAVETMEEIVIA